MASERAATPSRGCGRLSAPLPHASTNPWDASTDPWDVVADPWDVVADPWGVVATARPAFSCSDASIFRPLGQLCGCLGHCGRLRPHAFGCWKSATGDEREILADNLWRMAGATGYKFPPRVGKKLNAACGREGVGAPKTRGGHFLAQLWPLVSFSVGRPPASPPAAAARGGARLCGRGRRGVRGRFLHARPAFIKNGRPFQRIFC